MENEIRIDPRTNSTVIIAPNRNKRPSDFLLPKIAKKEGDCVFDRGNEDKTPTELLRIGNPWNLRVIMNKYPELLPNAVIYEENKSIYKVMGAYGQNEIIIDTYQHNVDFEDLEFDVHKQWLNAIIERELKLYQMPRIKHVFVFKNQGEKAGASIQHAHTQIMATYFIPDLIKEEFDNYNKDESLFEKMLTKETFLEENDNFVAIAPYASRFIGESLIFSKKKISSCIEMDEKMKDEFISILRNVLKNTISLFGKIDYNIVFHELKDSNFRFHVEIYPRLSTWAGVELGTKIYVNEFAPEEFSKYYNELKKNLKTI
ncbi:MAG: DUF4921 family protein [Candidatus Rehaiarchaeum fermentans]|nr:DUF4921 family protein [Candidatus Rehaiarchaeum fermentans]